MDTGVATTRTLALALVLSSLLEGRRAGVADIDSWNLELGSQRAMHASLDEKRFRLRESHMPFKSYRIVGLPPPCHG